MSVTTDPACSFSNHTAKTFYDLAKKHTLSLNKKFQEKSFITPARKQKLLECFIKTDKYNRLALSFLVL